MEKLLPILSGSLNVLIKSIVNKTNDPIATEILTIDEIVNNVNNICYAIDNSLGFEIENLIESKITDEVRMITIRPGEFEVSFLPKGKDPEYGANRTWLRKNRQTGKPARIFQKLLKKEFKTREWEIFTNLFKAELCECTEFKIVEGEDIRYWYYDEHYYSCDGTLGNSCMRYGTAQSYFDIYVENAKMLITTKDGLLTGRALVWEIDGVTILDRIYTCFDYLENCFIDYAKEHKWWIREYNGLLDTGDRQTWYSPDDDYTSVVDREFVLVTKKAYREYPYMDSFRYFDGGKMLSTCPVYNITLDCTDGEYHSSCWTCENCGVTFYGYSDEDAPDDLHWSDYNDGYYCDNCCWYSDGLEDYVLNSDPSVGVHSRYDYVFFPQSYIEDNLIINPNGTEEPEDIIEINNEFYFVKALTFNSESNSYEIRSSSN